MGIRELIQAIAGIAEGYPSTGLPGWQTGSGNSVICTVDDVDTTALTCTLTPVGRLDKYFNARLTATSGIGKSVVVIPKPGSYVIASVIHDNDVFVSMVEEAEKVIIRSEDFGGLVKVEELVSRLNAIENAFNSFLTEYKTHIHSVNVAGAVTVALTPTSTQTTLETTQQDQLENKEVVHG